MSLFTLSLHIVFSVMSHLSHFVVVRSSLRFYSSALVFEVPLDISCTKLLRNSLEPYSLKCNLPL